jgi:restriction system protein
MLKAVLSELKAAGGEARVRDLMDKAEPKLQLSDYEMAAYEKSGYVRWRSIVHFYSINCVKAGYIVKSGGKWRLTTEGEQALQLPAEDFVRRIKEKYRAWKRERAVEDAETEEESIVRQSAYEQALEQARSEIESHVSDLEPYDFQRLVAELLAAMGYHVPFVAPPGPDGGIDIRAYTDPLGTKEPRMLVQVKHRQSKVSVKQVRELEGLLRKSGDTGLIVSSGGFTAEAEREVQSSSKHIEIMDLDRLLDMWERHYDKIRDAGKALLPLVRLYFLAPSEEQ